VAAALVRYEELTITVKGAVFETDVVVIVVTVKVHVKLVEAEALAILSVALGFFDLSDQPIIHIFLLFEGLKKARGQARAFLSVNAWVCVIYLHRLFSIFDEYKTNPVQSQPV
jgi:hypothetical protein